MTKQCFSCKQELMIYDFTPNNHTKCGFSSKCKNCANSYARNRKIKNMQSMQAK